MKSNLSKVLAGMTLLAVGLGFVVTSSLPKGYEGDYDMEAFERLPVQQNGRIKPLDTLARNALLIMSGKQTVKLPEGGKINAPTWLMDLIMRPGVANGYKVFRIDHAEVLGMFGWTQEEKLFSYKDLEPHLENLVKQVEGIEKEEQLRSTFEVQLNKLYESLVLYNELVATFTTGTYPGMSELEYRAWIGSIAPGMEAIRKQQTAEEFDAEALEKFAVMADHYLELSKLSRIGIIPGEEKWANLGQGLLDTLLTKEIHGIISNYGEMTVGYRSADAEIFNRAVEALQAQYEGVSTSFEVYFNKMEPFYVASVLYVMVFLGVCIGWLWGGESLRKAAWRLLLVALVVHTFGLVARMIIMDRPPVTNLYSSAIFVGWGAVLMGMALEMFSKKGLGIGVASLVGFATLIIAHNLGLNGDTLEAVRAVLDSNFWLSTHVVVITLGYSAMFLAGILGVFYIIGGYKPGGLEQETKKNLVSMAYGVLAFATLFSFVGTMLGGVWADQSWGRFWGWDPKENGALLIVLWCAVVLHAKWGKLVGNQRFMALMVGGNIVTSWSWFGTNMLGVGLHSYGFMDRAFWALMVFIACQLVVISMGALKKH